MRIEVKDVDNNAKAWNEYSDEYTSNATFSDDLIHIGLGLVGVKPSDVVKVSSTILDIGCGNGINTALLAKQVCGNVVGVDPIDNQIKYAATTFVYDNLKFVCCEFKDITTHITGVYDLITAFGSLDYICIDENFFETIDTITHPDSRCFISKFHPFWTTLYGNDISEEQGNSYFDIERADCVRFGHSDFMRYHYPLSEIIKRFNRHGWILKEYLEPKPNIETSAFEYTGYSQDAILMQRLNNIPMTVVLEFSREGL